MSHHVMVIGEKCTSAQTMDDQKSVTLTYDVVSHMLSLYDDYNLARLDRHFFHQAPPIPRPSKDPAS